MESSPTTRALIVADRTAAIPRLQEELRRRVDAGPCAFTLLVPAASEPKTAEWARVTAVPLLTRAAGAPVTSHPGGPNAFEAVETAVRDGDIDEIIVSTLPRRTSKLLRRDLAHQLERLGVPVTAIAPPRPKPDRDYAVGGPPPGPA